MMLKNISLLIAAIILASAEGDHGSLHDKYHFSLLLSQDPSYMLHWSVDVSKQEASFAVNVSSQGWVGLGLSRNGQMIGSDVVTAWIDDGGEAQLQVRTSLRNPVFRRANGHSQRLEWSNQPLDSRLKCT
jgi:hypothetical protein